MLVVVIWYCFERRNNKLLKISKQKFSYFEVDASFFKAPPFTMQIPSSFEIKPIPSSFEIQWVPGALIRGNTASLNVMFSMRSSLNHFCKLCFICSDLQVGDIPMPNDAFWINFT